MKTKKRPIKTINIPLAGSERESASVNPLILSVKQDSRERTMEALLLDGEPPRPPGESSGKTPDAQDAPNETLQKSQMATGSGKTSEGAIKKVDPLVKEYGPLFVIDEKAAQPNQMAIAAKFASDYQVLFDPDIGSFVMYQNGSGRWEAIKDAKVKISLAKFVKAQAEASGARDFIPKRTNAFLGAVLGLLKGFTIAVDKSLLHRFIHVGNGMLNLSISPPDLLPFDPEYFSRRMCSVNYKADAECPRFLNDLLQASLSEHDIDLLQRFFGAVLLGDNAAQRFLIIYGGAARGKSTVVTLIERIIGVENVAHLRTEHLLGRFESHAFLNKFLLTAKDVAGDFLARRGAQSIKALVGDDQIESEQKYGGKFRMRGNFNIIVTSNNRLRLAMEDDEPAWRRRLIVIKFDGIPLAKRIANFGETLLQDEAEGILAWMIRGAVAHLEELDDIGDFKLTATQQTRIDDLLQESKSPGVFVASKLAKKKNSVLTVEELTEAYLDFCKAKRWEAVSARQFENALSDLMQKYHGVLKRKDIQRGTKWHRGFKHVALKTEALK